MSTQKEFEFNLKKARQSCFLLIGSSLVLFFLLTFFDDSKSKLFSEFNPLFILMTIFYLFFILNICRRLYLSFIIKPSIVLGEHELIIPTYHFGMEKINLNDIYSLESLSPNKKKETLVFGLQNNSGIFLDRQRFAKEEEFDEFKNDLKSIIVNISKNKLKIVNLSESSKFSQIPFSTYIISIICVLIYLIIATESSDSSVGSSFVFLGAGAKSVLNGQELYRIFSSPFIHANFFHLGINILALGMIGELLEKLISPVRLLNILLCSALAAFFAFAVFSNYEYGAGLSGGIFGICGAYVALRVRYDKFLPGSLSMVPLNRLLLVLAAEMIVEYFFLDNIDQYSHLGGFVAGFIYLYFMPLGEKLEKVNQPIMLEKVVFVGLALSYALGLSYFLMLYYGLVQPI